MSPLPFEPRLALALFVTGFMLTAAAMGVIDAIVGYSFKPREERNVLVDLAGIPVSLIAFVVTVASAGAMVFGLGSLVYHAGRAVGAW